MTAWILIRTLGAASFATMGLTGIPSLAATPNTVAGAHRDGQHDFDFAFGRWKTHISRLLHPLTGPTTWVEYDGIHTIHKIWNGKANLGELEADGPAGHIEAMSPRLYNPEAGQWNISYGNPGAGTLSEPVTGEFTADGRGEFYGEKTVNGSAVLVREVYTPVNATTRRLEIAYSVDGGKTWEANWKMTDTKIGDDSDPALVPAYVTDAVADVGRPADDVAQDANRRPVDVLAFADVKPGATVVDLMPGSGYYTRILSKIVGPSGKVYALQPVEMDKAAPKGLKSINSFAGSAAYANVTVLVQPVASIAVPERVDMVWTSMNYHDLHDPFLGSPDMAKFNKTIFATLKPGGIFFVLDHVAAPGSGFSKTNDLHRAEPAAVKAEVMAAGFEFLGESDVLHNVDDDHTKGIYDQGLRGHTDRFIHKFCRPLL